MQTQMQAPFLVTGSVEVELSVLQPTLCIVINAAAMNITGAALKQLQLEGVGLVVPIFMRWAPLLACMMILLKLLGFTELA